MSWYWFRIDAPHDKHNEILFGEIREICDRLQAEGLVNGFSANSYYGREERDFLKIRLDYNPEVGVRILTALKEKFESISEPLEYREKDREAKGYELGTRWAFLFHDLVTGGRYQASFSSLSETPEFIHAIHGLLNDLGYDYPQEIILHERLIRACRDANEGSAS